MMKYKTTLTNEMCAFFEAAIERLLDTNVNHTITSTLAMAALCEVLLVLRKKRVEYKRSYNISFTPVQAFSLCFLYTWLETRCIFSVQITNRLHQINNDVLKHYGL